MNVQPLNEAALAELDAQLSTETSPRWDRFYADRARPCPFFGAAPDESLHGWLHRGRIPAPAGASAAALDLGCGNGRNAVFLAQRGFAVTGVDFSPEAIAWAQQRAAAACVALSLIQSSVFDAPLPEGGFDLVVDSGCFHHLPPHRRASYVQRVHRALAPGGHLTLTCFRPEGGSGLSDAQVYERGTLGGGQRRVWGGVLVGDAGEEGMSGFYASARKRRCSIRAGLRGKVAGEARRTGALDADYVCFPPLSSSRRPPIPRYAAQAQNPQRRLVR